MFLFPCLKNNIALSGKKWTVQGERACLIKLPLQPYKKSVSCDSGQNTLKSSGRASFRVRFEFRPGGEGVKGVKQVRLKEGLKALCKLLSKKEVHYKMLSSGVWLPAKPLLSSLQLRAFEASHQWVCLNCLGMRPRSPADVSAASSALGLTGGAGLARD